MRVMSKLSPLAVAVSLGVSALAAPVAVNAETSASIAASNFYLWRGQNLNVNGGAAFSGSLDYNHESGLYAGVWTSSEGGAPDGSDEEDFPNPRAAGNSEYDLYVGYAGEAGSLGYDVSLWSYEYPEAAGPVSYGDASELIIGLSMADFSFTLYDSLQGGNSYIYYTLGYSYDKFGVTLGTWSFDNEDLTKDHKDYSSEYQHLDLSFAATDEVTFTLSKVINDDDETTGDTDTLINVSWSKSFDL